MAHSNDQKAPWDASHTSISTAANSKFAVTVIAIGSPQLTFDTDTQWTGMSQRTNLACMNDQTLEEYAMRRTTDSVF